MERDGGGANAQNDENKVRFEPTYVEGTALSPRLALPASTTMNPYSIATTHTAVLLVRYYGRRSDSAVVYSSESTSRSSFSRDAASSSADDIPNSPSVIASCTSPNKRNTVPTQGFGHVATLMQETSTTKQWRLPKKLTKALKVSSVSSSDQLRQLCI